MEEEYPKIEQMYELSKDFNAVARQYDDVAATYTDSSLDEKLEKPTEKEREDKASKREKTVEMEVCGAQIDFLDN